MNTVVFIVLYLYLLLVKIHSDEAKTVTEYDNIVSWQTGLTLYSYQSYKSARILQYEVPIHTTKSSWGFKLNGSLKCSLKHGTIYGRHGSFPVINPNNETFPAHFQHNYPSQPVIHITSNNDTYNYEIQKPKSGLWFFVAYLNGEEDNKIAQQGISGDNCNYYLDSTHMTTGLESIPSINMNEVIAIKLRNEKLLYKFKLTGFTWSYNINITSHNIENPCTYRLSSSGSHLPRNQSINCSTDDVCMLKFLAAQIENWQYIEIEAQCPNDVTIEIFIKTNDCKYFFDTGDMSINDNNKTITNVSKSATNETEYAIQDGVSNRLPDPFTATCRVLPPLARIYKRSSKTRVQYSLRAGPIIMPNKIRVLQGELTVFRFDLDPVIDIGLTLRLYGELLIEHKNVSSSDQLVVFSLCIQPSKIPINYNQYIECDEQSMITLNSTNPKSQLYIPYPVAGPWFISFTPLCFPSNISKNGQTQQNNITCQSLMYLAFSLNLSPCVSGECDDKGYCKEYYGNGYLYSSCDCKAGNRGYGCTDNTHAKSNAEQLLESLLLTMSNIAMIPAIALALYRHYYVEALVYTYTMLFSTFYHACDGDRENLYCLMPYNVMSHCDFFGSITSFWVTLLAMAKLTEKLRVFLFTLSGLMLSLGVTWNRYSLWTFLVPCLVAVIIVIIAWTLKCRSRRYCFPPPSIWLKKLLPGCLCAGGGLIVFAFLETDSNYHYTHSSWHVLMAFSIVFLLPTRSKERHLYIDQ